MNATADLGISKTILFHSAVELSLKTYARPFITNLYEQKTVFKIVVDIIVDHR